MRDQSNARKGIGVRSADSGGFSSLNWGRRRRAPSAEPISTRSHNADESDAEEQADDGDSESESDSDLEVAPNGLTSRKRMHQAYQITSQNDMERKGGREDYFISRAVFAQLARHIAAQQRGDGEGAEEGEDGEGRPLVITEDNCDVM